jgi:hypothetical protein
MGVEIFARFPKTAVQVPQGEIWGRERRKVLLSYYYTCCPTNLKMLPPPCLHLNAAAKRKHLQDARHISSDP